VAVRSGAEANAALIRAFVGDWERRDTDAILAYFTEDAVYHCMPLPPVVGKPALAVWVRGFEGTPPARLEINHQVASAEVVMNERTDHITLNGRAVVLPICAVFELENGRIKAWREYLDLVPARAAFENT
jgi:limonene-1,2-epoxide hydrolase